MAIVFIYIDKVFFTMGGVKKKLSKVWRGRFIVIFANL